MKKYDRYMAGIIFCIVLVIACTNVLLLHWQDRKNTAYNLDLNRIQNVIGQYEAEKKAAPESLDVIKDYSGLELGYITALKHIAASEYAEAYSSLIIDDENVSCTIYFTEQNIYRIDYRDETGQNTKTTFLVNVILLFCLVLVAAILFYVRQNIIRPFNQVSELPYELSKGNLTVPLKENKNRYFGKFLWGMDLLREKLEDNKRREIELEREKKLLLMSLSHDIKTPLSAIKLYANALGKDLYKEEEKKKEVAASINVKVDEMEKYISQIVDASNDDFLDFQVEDGELYVGEALEYIKKYYNENMAISQIEFRVEEYRNCIIKGDKERVIEIIQNLVENAIKYGDGKNIWIKTESDDEAYYISVINTGCTLPDREMPHIFDSFFRGSNVEKKEGSGLGLYICRKLMHLMNGEIMAEKKSSAKNGEDKMCIRLAFRIVN